MTMRLTGARADSLLYRGKRLCNLWKITRKDGTVLRFTDLPKPFAFVEDGGAFYQPGGSGSVSAERREAGIKDGNLSLLGVFSSGAITVADIESGLYRDARVDHWIVAWDPGPGRVIRHSVKWVRTINHATGEIYTASMEGRERFLQRPVGGRFDGIYSKVCTYTLADPTTCKADITGNTIAGVRVDAVVDLSGNKRLIFECDPATFAGGTLPVVSASTLVEVIAGNTYRATSGLTWTRTPVPGQLIDVSGFVTGANNGTKRVSAADSTTITVEEALTVEAAGASVTITRQYADDYFRDGEAVWTLGDNADDGVVSPITGYQHDDGAGIQRRVTLFLPTPNDIQVGDEFTIKPGCDGLRSTCRDKFFPVGGFEGQPGGNILNFGGSDFDPGSDQTINPAIPE